MTRARWATFARRAGVVAAVVFVAVAIDIVFRDFNFAEIKTAVLCESPLRLSACVAFTAASFACLALYDVVSVQAAAPDRVRPGVAFLAGATSAAIANTLGFHAFSGSAVRAHLYLPEGLMGAQVARVASMSWWALAAGNMTMLASAELWEAATGLDSAWHATLGVGLGGVLLLSLAWLARAPRQLRLWRFHLRMPTASLALQLMVLGAIESGMALGALYVMLPADLTPPFDVFTVGCIAAVVLGMVSHVPGGVGVFEVSMIAILAGRGRLDLLAALLSYRLVYNLLPFVLAVLALGWRTGCKSLGARLKPQVATARRGRVRCNVQAAMSCVMGPGNSPAVPANATDSLSGESGSSSQDLATDALSRPSQQERESERGCVAVRCSKGRRRPQSGRR